MPFQFSPISDAKDYLLTAFFLIIAMVLLAGRYQSGIDNLRKVSITLFSYMEEPLSQIRVYRRALSSNTDLRRQNVRLLDKLSRLRATQQENKKLRNLLQFKRNSKIDLFPAHIVGKVLNEINNTITIQGGSADSLKVGMPMVTPDGLAGKIVLTSPHYSRVMPYFNTLFRVSAKIQHTNAYGIVSWDGENIRELELNYVPQTVPVDTGQVVVTSGYSNEFPPDIPIGTIVGSEPLKGKDTQKIFLRPFVNLYEIGQGFIIKFQPDTSRKALDRNYKKLFK